MFSALEELVGRFELEHYKPLKDFKCNCNQYLATDDCRHIRAIKALSKAKGEL